MFAKNIAGGIRNNPSPLYVSELYCARVMNVIWNEVVNAGSQTRAMSDHQTCTTAAKCANLDKRCEK